MLNRKISKRKALLGATVALTAALGASLPLTAHAFSQNDGTVNVTTILPVSGNTTGLVSQDVTFHIQAQAGHTFSNIAAHLCDPAAGAITQNSQWIPPGNRCTGNVVGSSSPGSLSVTVDPSTVGSAAGAGADFTFHTGTGTSVVDGANPHAVTCTAATPCNLVLRVDTTPDGFDFIEVPLTFAGTPSTPSAPTVGAKADSQATVSFPAASTLSTGQLANGTFSKYVVNAYDTAVSTAVPATSVNVTSASATSVVVPLLQNFHNYEFGLQLVTVAADGTTLFPSAESAHSTPVYQPGPAGPSNVSGTPADSSVALSWSPPANTVGLTRYFITANRTGGNPDAGAPHTAFTTGAPTNFTFTGLVNGTIYTFTVQAEYGAGNLSAGATSAPVTPQGKFITQHINVTRPNGDLVLTQQCGGPTSGGLYDPTVGVYPTDCTVNLGTAKLITTGPGAGQFFQATGALNQVTVVDTRDTDPGWNVNASVSNFTAGPGKTFSGNDLGWVPVVTDHSLPFTADGLTYTQTVTAGGTQVPVTGTLGSGATFATGAVGVTTPPTAIGGLGIAHLDAALTVNIPVFAKSGAYTAVMTITAV